MDEPALQQLARTVFAPWVQAAWTAVRLEGPDQVVLDLANRPDLAREGGVLSGQVLAAACDSAMVLALLCRIGRFRPLTTVDLHLSFLKPVVGTARVRPRVTRLGRGTAFAECGVEDAQGQLLARAMGTFALLPEPPPAAG